MIGTPTISVAEHVRPAWTLLAIPQAVDEGAEGGYASVRILDDRNKEVPYVLDPACAELQARSAEVSDVGFVRGSYTQALLDTGSSGDTYSSVTIETPMDTFFTRADVAISDDRLTWREVANNALIYRVASSGDPGSQAISFSPARARYIRVRVHDARNAFPIEGASLGEVAIAAPHDDRVLRADVAVEPDRDGMSVLTFDLGTKHHDASQIAISTSTPEFARDVTLFTSSDGEEWGYAGSGRLERFAHGNATLAIPVHERARYIRAQIANGSDEPLEHLSAVIYGPRHYLVFIAKPGRTYHLARARGGDAPRYDLQSLMEHDDPRSLARASVAGEASDEPVAQNKQARGVQSVAINIAFGAAISLVLAITLLTLRRRPTA